MSEPLHTARRVSRRRILKSLKSKSQTLTSAFGDNKSGIGAFFELDFVFQLLSRFKTSLTVLVKCRLASRCARKWAGRCNYRAII